MAKRRQPVYGSGSVSCATHRVEDLIPAFVDELEYLIQANGGNPRGKAWKELRAIKKRMTKKGYYASDEAYYDLNEYLFDALDEFSAPYFYFGGHPGDGADFGFWLSEMFEEDFDGLKVSDLSEVPRDYRGEVLEVNDHGNMTLVYKNSRSFRVLWAIV